MSDGFGFKKGGAFRLWGAIAAIALASWGVWTLCGGETFGKKGTSEYAFDGWTFDREDRRNADAALAAAGLNDYRWEDGKLSVPRNKKSECQTALAAAGAYPKAPSEFRREAIQAIGAFESESKTRLRELDACAYQLERTLERFSGVEYATVGVRARREQDGLVAKSVVTASVGVACKDGFSLELDAISAITVATKHQLGVEKNENISIIDLKEGKSYFGTEKSVGNATSLAYFNEKERVEKYWRSKFLETFDYIKNVRISVAVDLRFAERSAKGAKTRASAVAPLESAPSAPFVAPPSSGAYATLGNPNGERSAASRLRNSTGGVYSASFVGKSASKIKQASATVAPPFAAPRSVSAAGDVANFADARLKIASTSTLTTEATEGSEATFEIRSLVVRIAIPRRYARRVAQSLAAEKGETLEGSGFVALCRSTERDVIDEIKRVALKMTRPIQERNGWSDVEAVDWIDVSVFDDVDDEIDAAESALQEGTAGSELVADNVSEPENWRVFGNFASVSERVADNAEGGEETPPSAFDRGIGALALDWKDPLFWGGVVAVALFVWGVVALGTARKKRGESAANQRKSQHVENQKLARNAAATKTLEKNGERPASSRERRSTPLSVGEKRNERVDFGDFGDELDDFEDDLEIASSFGFASKTNASETDAPNYSSKRREALDFVAKNPERAASALKNWVKRSV